VDIRKMVMMIISSAETGLVPAILLLLLLSFGRVLGL